MLGYELPLPMRLDGSFVEAPPSGDGHYTWKGEEHLRRQAGKQRVAAGIAEAKHAYSVHARRVEPHFNGRDLGPHCELRTVDHGRSSTDLAGDERRSVERGLRAHDRLDVGGGWRTQRRLGVAQGAKYVNHQEQEYLRLAGLSKTDREAALALQQRTAEDQLSPLLLPVPAFSSAFHAPEVVQSCLHAPHSHVLPPRAHPFVYGRRGQTHATQGSLQPALSGSLLWRPIGVATSNGPRLSRGSSFGQPYLK